MQWMGRWPSFMMEASNRPLVHREASPVQSGLWRTREHRSWLSLVNVKHSALPFKPEPVLGQGEVLDLHPVAEPSHGAG